MTLRHEQKNRHAGTIVGFLHRIIIIIQKSELLLMEENDRWQLFFTHTYCGGNREIQTFSSNYCHDNNKIHCLIQRILNFSIVYASDNKSISDSHTCNIALYFERLYYIFSLTGYISELWGSHSSVAEDSLLLGYEAASMGNRFPTFRMHVLSRLYGSKLPKDICWPFKMKKILLCL
jgi:hypothetical protein